MEKIFKNYILLRSNILSERKFKEWIKQEGAEKNKEANFLECPFVLCPRKRDIISKNVDQSNDENLEEEIPFLELMAVGGGVRKEPLKTFLDLVKKVHKAPKGKIRNIYITDRYLLKDEGEDGSVGGYENICKYLNILGLDRKSCFSLSYVNVKDQAKKDIWESFLRTRYPNITFKNISKAYRFHDRFYIVEYVGGDVKGVFGPSMNGLCSTSIVLMGEIEKGAHSLGTIHKWLDEK